jgi:uncharacterized protein with GYD domain
MTMPTYIALLNYTDKGAAQIEGSPDRLDKANALLRQMGGEFKQLYLTMGNFDLIVIYEAPDDATSARFSLRLGKLGYVRANTKGPRP